MANRSRETDTDALFERVWRTPEGFVGWFRPVNQSRIGRRYIVTAFVFFALAGVLALLMRLQLAVPENTFLAPDTYNQFFTMHGTTMMFLFAVPMMEGLAIYLMPLMIGTRDMAFPRLSAMGYYVYLIAGGVLYLSLFLGLAPDAGWFAYVPLADGPYSGAGMDVWTTMITFMEVSALAAAVEIIVTVLKQRAPGMSLHRMPLFVWAMLVMAFMIVFAMPPLIVGSLMLALDRLVETRFFDPTAGGDPLLWQHLFWFFGHPEVYIIFIPALGIVSTVIITFTRRPIFGYPALVLSLIATAFIAFGLWVHHMFTTGLPHLGISFFSAASFLIAIPSGVQIFCWLASLWGTRPRLATPMWYIVGFFLIFVLGGLTGVMVAAVPFDTQVHDTFFVVAHFHYVLIGGAVFPLFAGVYYWYPKMTGRLMNETLGKWSAALTFVGFNVTFFPMHQLGLQGMPRRVYTYLAELDWGGLNLLVTIGAFVLAFGFALTLINAVVSYWRGRAAGDNPWDADTLEWSIPSPPPTYNFRHLPVVNGRYPLWEQTAGLPTVAGLRDDRRELLLTSVLDAVPQAVLVLPGPTLWPFAAALAIAVGFIGVMFHPSWFVVGLSLAFAAFIGWLWPRQRHPPAETEGGLA